MAAQVENRRVQYGADAAVQYAAEAVTALCTEPQYRNAVLHLEAGDTDYYDPNAGSLLPSTVPVESAAPASDVGSSGPDPSLPPPPWSANPASDPNVAGAVAILPADSTCPTIWPTGFPTNDLTLADLGEDYNPDTSKYTGWNWLINGTQVVIGHYKAVDSQLQGRYNTSSDGDVHLTEFGDGSRITEISTIEWPYLYALVQPANSSCAWEIGTEDGQYMSELLESLRINIQ
jgi:hypothetical protein